MLYPAEILDPEQFAGRDWPGYCAVCRERRLVRLCAKCHAAICDDCRPRGLKRILAAIKAAVGGGSHGAIWVVES